MYWFRRCGYTGEGKDGEFIVQESGLDDFGHVKLGGVGQLVCDEVEKHTGFEARVTVLGHLQRGGTPTAFIGYWGQGLVLLQSTW